jgi:HEAT repeat protein
VVAQFTDTNDQVIEAHITVRPEVIDALGKLARGGGGMAVRANAARAAGVLRGGAASDDLVEALKSKDDRVMYEVLVALQKIGDPANGPKIAFLLRDLSDRVQIAALETTGVLRNMEAAPRVREVLAQPRNDKVRRAALTTLAMLADPSNREIYSLYLADKDDEMRAAAAEGFARLADPADQPKMEQAFNEERKTNARLSMAFAVVATGNATYVESSALQYLVSTANQRMYRDVAQVFLIELARNENVRQALYPAIAVGTRNEKIVLARALAASGGQDAIPYLEALTKDTDSEAAQEGFRALRNLRARLG